MNSSFRREHKNITLALNGRLFKSMRQFDQIDGLCAKINELFNGAFLEQSRHFQQKSKSGFDFEDQSMDICYSTYIYLIFYLRINALPLPQVQRMTRIRRMRKRFDFIYFVSTIDIVVEKSFFPSYTFGNIFLVLRFGIRLKVKLFVFV